MAITYLTDMSHGMMFFLILLISHQKGPAKTVLPHSACLFSFEGH